MVRERRRGRRPKRLGDTRARILEVALHRFAASGFGQVTSVEIAREAGVDPALIHYYFDSKETLLFESVRERLAPQMETAFSRAGPPSPIGESIVDAFLGLWDAEEQGKALAAIVRAAVSNDRIGQLFQRFIAQEVLPRVASSVREDGQELRVGLAATQLLGLGLVRYVVRLEPVASAPRETVVRAVGPAITRYLTQPTILRKAGAVLDADLTRSGTASRPDPARGRPRPRGSGAAHP